MSLRHVAARGGAVGHGLPRRPVSLGERPVVPQGLPTPALGPPPLAGAANYWGVRFLMAVLAGLALTMVVGPRWGLGLLTIVAVGASLVGRLNPVVGALGVTCLCVLDPMAADFLTNPVDGDALGALTVGFWRYNTVGYVLAFGAVTNLPALQRALAIVHVRWAASLLLAVTLGLALSRNFVIGSQISLDFLAYFGLLAYVLRVADDGETWYWMGVVGGTLGALATPLYFAGQSSLVYTNPNVIVFTPVAALFATWLGFITSPHDGRRQMQLGVLAATNLLWTFLSTSRGGLITAGICALFLLFAVRSAGRRLVLVASSVLLAVVVMSSFTKLQESAVARFQLLFDSSVSSRLRTSGRDELARGALEMFTRNPMGVGTGSFEASWAELGSVNGQRVFMRSGQQFAAHAGWLRVLAENGVIGIVLLAGFILSFGWVGLHRGRDHGRLLGLSVTLAIGTALVSTEFHLKAQFFLAAGATALLHGNWARFVTPAPPASTRRRPTLTVQPSPMEVH